MQTEQQQRIMGYFIDEAKEHLNTIEQGLLNLQNTITDREMVNEVFRAAHSIKGGAAMLGISSIQKTAHRLEDCFKLLKECPVKVDNKLETLFLKVFDTLSALVAELPKPFGLTEEIAKKIMVDVEPIFAELNNHVNQLVQNPGSSTSELSAALEIKPTDDKNNRKALEQTFEKTVLAQLRELLQIFRQPEQPVNRQELQKICRSLIALGQQFNLPKWNNLLETASSACANPSNSFRTLASIVIKEIKQAQELVLADRETEILPSRQLKALVPPESRKAPAEESLTSSPGERAKVVESKEEFNPLKSEPKNLSQPAIPFPATRIQKNYDKAMKKGAAARNVNEPEVGILELDSLAELFSGETPELDENWQSETTISNIDAKEMMDSIEELNLDLDSDFADLLIESDNQKSTAPEISELDDFMNLFGEEIQSEAEVRVAKAEGLSDEDFSDFLWETEQPELQAKSAKESDDLSSLFGEEIWFADESSNPSLPDSVPKQQDDEELLNILTAEDVNEALSTAANSPNALNALNDDSSLDNWLNELSENEFVFTPADFDPELVLIDEDRSNSNNLLEVQTQDVTEESAAKTPVNDLSLDFLEEEGNNWDFSSSLEQTMAEEELDELDEITDKDSERIISGEEEVLSKNSENKELSKDKALDVLFGETQLDENYQESSESSELSEDLGIETFLEDQSLDDLFEDEESDEAATLDETKDNLFGEVDEFLEPSSKTVLPEAAAKLEALFDAEGSDELASALDLDEEWDIDSALELAPAQTDEAAEKLDALFDAEDTLIADALESDEEWDIASALELDTDDLEASGKLSPAEALETSQYPSKVEEEWDDLSEFLTKDELFLETDGEESADKTPQFDISLDEFEELEANLNESETLDTSELHAADTEEFDEWDALLDEDVTLSGNDDKSSEEFDELDALLDEDVTASGNDDKSSEEFDELDALLDEDVTFSVNDDKSTDEFDDLDAWLNDNAVGELTNSNDFDELENLLTQTPPIKAEKQLPPKGSSYESSATANAVEDEFDELEKMMQDSDSKISPPSLGKAPLQPIRSRLSKAFGDQTTKVPVKHLDNLSNLVGELVVSRNSLEQDQERMRQFLDNLLSQVQQLSDVGARMQDLYERSLLETSIIASRQHHRNLSKLDSSSLQLQNPSKYDPLEMDQFSPIHLLSQEMIELIVRVRESASDIEFLVEETDQVARMLRLITTQLQEGLTRSRMAPFKQTAERLPRAVRDISMKLNKQAELIVDGKDTLIDNVILEKLYDPMTHLINNAMTHGIEEPQKRIAAGKSPVGRITIQAFHQGNQTVISVSDDGAGIDIERVKAKAIEKRLISSQDAKSLSKQEVYEFLFDAGFSTQDQANDFAGRGVGMNVVITSLNEIRGIISTESTLGKGTTFTIRLPLTLSIGKALCCLSDRASIAFPMDGVEDMFDVPVDAIKTDTDEQRCIAWRDTLLPFQSLSELLTYNRQLSRGSVYGGKREDNMISIVVLRSAGNFLAVQVDKVVGEQEIVIKQLHGPVPKPVGIAGATVLGDGRIMPIADVLELIDLSRGVTSKQHTDLWLRDHSVPEVPVKTEPMVLIVDDSITVRELLSMTFNKAGYRVEQARDGQEAWDKLRSGLPCDIVFCDIEMPRMDGLELLSRIQKDDTLNHLPVAMLTSRGAVRHQQMAAELGASGYFTKPYLEEALLDAAQRMMKGEVLLHAPSNA